MTSDQTQTPLTHGAKAGPRWAQREIGRFGFDHAPPTSSATLVVVGGVHGDEHAGLHAARRVLDALGAEQPTGFHGRLVALAGNLAALVQDDPPTRYIDHDLNRLFTDEQIALPPETSAEHGQMQELLAALRAVRAQSERMIVIDLHTTSADAPPVVVMEDAIAARRFARAMPLPIYLGFEEELPGLLIDRVTSEMGSVAMVVEGGRHDDPRSVDVHEAVIWSALAASGILALGAMPHAEAPGRVLRGAAGAEAGKVYDIRHLHPITNADFTIAPGVFAGMRVRPGVTTIATEHGRPVTSPVRGRVFLPNMQTRKRAGDDGFFIVRHVGEGWLGFSARLRRQAWLHRLIAHMPGVYEGRGPCGREELIVDADIAAVLKRQIFHLLGYRLLRHDRRDAGRGVARIARGVGAFFKALIRGPIRPGPDREDPRFWVVARHKLDR